ncbi:MAG: PEP-CTERM sorting domain-containing protein, partial [Planctomycetales bacterium]|nr:PEP-CTERM sorting domain-containing protein [Planctomycetales bacterium]
MTKNTFPLRIVHAIGLGVLVCMVAGQAQATVLLLENFDSLAPQLGNATTPGEIAARNVWTPDAPTSWTVDRSKVAGDPTAGAGVAEFEGWTFLDRDWYVATAGDQRRSEFTKAYGVVAVADADEYDDLGGPLGGTINPFRTNIFNSTLFSKQIPLSGAAANSVRVKFDSAWRPEGEQTGIVMAQFDGGAATPILTFSSINGNVNFKADALNETVDIPVNNPGGASNLTLSWQLTDAVNNWFWAIDNIQVYTGSPVADEPVMRAVIDRDTGRVAVINNTGANVSLRGYSIVSKAGAFDDAQANFFSEIDSNWIQFTDPGSGKDISEGHKTTGTIAAGATFELGNAWAKYFQDETDVEFTYLLPGSNEPVVGNLSFEGNGGNSYPFLDLNFDNTVDINDWITFRNGVGADLTGMSRAQAYRVGDLNGDLAYSPADFIIFKTEYDRVNGTGAFASISSVPEPASVLSLVTALVVGCLFRRRLTPKVILLLLAATIVMMAGPAYAQLVLINENFDNLPYGPNVEEALAGDNVWTDTPPAGWTIDDSGIPG